MNTTTFVVTEGQRWDIIAYLCYGDARLYPDIILANPNVSANIAPPAGTVLSIPIKETKPVAQILPPWKS